MLILKRVLNDEELAELRGGLATASFAGGAKTAGPQAKKVKRNLQLPLAAPERERLGKIVTGALGRNKAFFSAALPNRIVPILFNRYEIGMEYGAHVDNAYMLGLDGKGGTRTDISATLFLSDPAGYEGGELSIQVGPMVQRVKLPAGDMVLYPSNTRHRVEPVTRGARDAAVFWVQSMVRHDDRRQMLFDLDRTVQGLVTREPEAPEVLALTNLYNNLLREWIEV